MKELNVIVVGDSMLDRYIEGDLRRVSPETPCPLIDVAGELEMPGGAANIAANLLGLKVPCELITVLGGENHDEGADALRACFDGEKRGKIHAFHFKGHLTPIRTRVCTLDGRVVLRYDHQNERPFVDAGVNNAVWNKTESALKHSVKSGVPTALVLADYGKGVLIDDDLVKGILALAQVLRVPTVVSPCHNNFARYAPATVIKTNLKWAKNACGGKGMADCAERLIHKFYPAIQSVIVTNGGDGMTIGTYEDTAANLLTVPAYPYHSIRNAISLGDTVTAVLASQLACVADDYGTVTHRLPYSAKCASVAAGAITTKAGTAVINDYEYSYALSEQGVEPPDKSVDIDTACAIADKAQDNHEDVVFVAGNFDQLHPGHLHLLQEARRIGDMLIVGVRSDEAIRRLKGEGKPIIPCVQRVKMLEALSCTTAVIVFDEDTPEKVIRALKPDFYILGQEHYSEEISKVPGAEYVLDKGKGVMFVKMLEGYDPTEATKAHERFSDT